MIIERNKSIKERDKLMEKLEIDLEPKNNVLQKEYYVIPYTLRKVLNKLFGYIV